MSIVVYTGKPGAGKSYRVVHELLRDEGRYYVFHNVDGLKEVLIEEGKYIEDWRSIPGFLTKAKQEELALAVRERYGRSMLVIVDEAQMIMADKNSEIKAWLSWHRHLGQDVKIICQHYKMIASDLYNLADYEIRGKRGFVTNQFVYQWCVNGEVFKTDRLKKSKATFAAYKSFVGAEVTKGRSRLLALGIGGCVIAMAMGIYTIGWGLPATFSNQEKKRGKVMAGKEVSERGKNKEAENGREKTDDRRLVDVLAKYSYAGYVGGEVMVQDLNDLGIRPLSGMTSYQVIEVNGRRARVMIPKIGMMVIGTKGQRYQAGRKMVETRWQ